MSPYDRLQTLGITLPEPVPPAAAFVPFVRSGNLLFVSGHIARKAGKSWRGRLGADVSTEEGREAARGVAIDLVATLQAATGDLRHVVRIVKLLVLVNSDQSFTDQPRVADGASTLLADVFGPAGSHARSAIGVAQLPLGSCVEIELIAEVVDAG
jgi:enamine deaminase RidA (YjgF/YER057c/UK114 family)